MTLCYLGLGSNLDHPQRQLQTALLDLRQLPRTILVASSSIYKSRPLGIKAQPNYRNMVVSIKTTLRPEALLKHCKAIEKKHQRITKQRWGSRTLDIDILLFGDLSLNLPHLKIPHPEMHRRDFVLVPLQEIAPKQILINGMKLGTCLEQGPGFISSHKYSD